MDLDDDDFDELAADKYSSKTTASLAEFFRTTSPPGFVDPHPASHRPRSLGPQVALQYSPSSTTPRYTPLETVRAPDHEEMQPSTTPRTLHRAERIFKLTTDNRPHYDDLSCIFSVLTISLPLMDHFVGVFSAPYPLSFKADDAVSNLMNLKMQQNVRSFDRAGNKTTSTTITSYQVDRPMCLKLMQSFMSAHFIKCANDPTTEKFSENLLLQLTPKGCAVLYLFTQRNGISAPNVTSLLKYHSSCMRLVTLERDPLTDYIYTSSQFVEIVFQRFAGTSPNYYHSSSSSSSGHSAHHSKNSNSISTLKQPNMSGMLHTGTGSSTSTYVFSGKQRQQSAPPMSASGAETVPDPGFYFDKNSDSGMGVRIYEVKRLHLKEYKHCFSGADARRWIMDWTTAINNQEAQILLDEFVDQGLIVRLDGKSGSSATSFIVDKNAHYTLASKGRQLAGWPPLASRSSSGAPVSKVKRPESPITRVSSPGADKTQKLNSILENPALRLLFREHLEDHLCVENLVLYSESSKVIAMYEELERDDFATATIQKVDVCISEAWVVYHVFLARGSASEVNIDYDLRTRVREGMTAIRSPDTSTKEKSPKSLDVSIANLKRIISLLIEVRSQVFSLMAADSVPKFLKTSKFLESNLEIA
ncbi:hypothetical protein BZA70DRAFT_30198 [Myxozyma melibiosi]|uniref:RGS domain-containing protein n=1 Tax=Myxozyma melibiosi TaxID=54550 RepID=A0ABR1FDI6_9ASCO